MPTPIRMPALSPTMEEGKLLKWHVEEGDDVRAGDLLAEVETDKATMEIEADKDGRIGMILVPEGTEHVRVNQPIALLVMENANGANGLEEDSAGETSEAESESRPPVDIVVTRAEDGPENEAGSPRASDRIVASPLAKRLAKEHGIDLDQLHGSGPHGRILKRDVETVARTAPEPDPMPRDEPEQQDARQQDVHAIFEAIREQIAEGIKQGGQRELVRAAPAEPRALSDEQIFAVYQPGSYELVPHDTMRKVIAGRLSLSKQTIPHFYLSIDCEVDALLAARERLNALAPEEGPHVFKLSINDFIIKALAMALQKVPRANASWSDEGLILHRSSDIAVAVALDGGGLHTPVLRHAELKSLSEISNEMRDLAARARSKRLAPHEYQGGSTTLSNLGMYGISQFDAIINPPQASILAIGRAAKQPIIKNDAVKIATMMHATLSVDHRVIDGALGAEMLAAFKAFLEDPVTMLV
jgi:pyruvate dehydrogenase E2 component (dihydrolipoamide acetyltransferase)